MDKKEINSKVSSDLKRNQDVTALIVSLLLSGALLYLLVAPTYDKKVELESINLSKQEDLKSKQELLKNIDSFNKKVKDDEDLSDNSLKLVSIIPNRNNFEDFFVHLKERSKSNSLELTDMSLTAVSANPATPAAPAAVTPTAGAVGTEAAGETTTAAGSKLNSQGISLRLRGSYSDFLKFTKELENGIAFLQMDSFKIMAAKEEEATTPVPGEEPVEEPVITDPILDFELELRFIYY